MVARKQVLPGSPPGAEKVTPANISPRKETGSPRVPKKGPPVAKKPVRDSMSDENKPGSPRTPDGPDGVQTGSVQTGSPLVSRREPVQSQVFEPEIQVVQQSPRQAAGRLLTSFSSIIFM